MKYYPRNFPKSGALEQLDPTVDSPAFLPENCAPL
jgi:hypothetical protein